MAQHRGPAHKMCLVQEQGCIYYIYKDVISVCLFVCPIITQEPLDQFAANFDLGTRYAYGKVLGLVS